MVARVHGRHTAGVLRNPQTGLHTGGINLLSHHQSMSSFLSGSLPILVIFDFWIIAILMGMKRPGVEYLLTRGYSGWEGVKRVGQWVL